MALESQESLSTQIRKVLQILLYVFYLILFYTQEFVRKQIRNVFGPKKENGKVLVSRILWKQKLDVEEMCRREDFITSYGEWMDLEVLQNPNWLLYTVEKDRVFFVLLPRPVSYYSVERFPFMFVPIYNEAVAVAEVQKEEFLQLAQGFADRPQPKTVLFTNTARCGSTLMAKMLHRPGHSQCFGEPNPLCDLAIALGEGTMTEEEVKELLAATVICLRAHVPDDNVCVLKTTSGEARLVALCKDISHLKHMFMFRKKGLLPVERIVRREAFMTSLLLNLYNFSPLLCRFISHLIAQEGPTIRQLKPENLRMHSAIVYAAPYSYYLANKSSYCHPIVWYHDLMEETSKTLALLFTDIGIGIECVEEAVACKAADSQKNSFLSREMLKDVKIPPMTEEDKAALEHYREAMKLPEDTFEC